MTLTHVCTACGETIAAEYATGDRSGLCWREACRRRRREQRADFERREAETRAARMVEVFGSPHVAARECRVQLRAIEPYRDRELSAALAVLDKQIEASR